MKRRILIVALAAAVFLITGVVYAAGDLIVNGNLGVGTPSPQGKADINGNMIVQGNATVQGNLATSGTATLGGNTAVNGQLSVGTAGVKFSDGSVQAKASNVSVQTNVTALRNFGAVYQNTTGKTLFVSVSGYSNAVAGIAADTDSSNPPTLNVAHNDNPAGYIGTVFFVVLPNNYYRVRVDDGSPTKIKWIEWY